MPQEINVNHKYDIPNLDKLLKAAEKLEEGLLGSKDSKQITELTAKIKKLEEIIDSVGRGGKKVEKNWKDQNGLVNKQISLVKDLRKSQKFAKTENELKDVNSRLKQANQKLKEMKNTTQSWNKAMGSFQFKFNFLGNFISNLATNAFRKLNDQIKKSINIVKDFESAMAGVKAITGATDVEFKRLERDAIRLGGATIFTAKQVADLQIQYAKLGFSTSEILNATEATLQLAAATDEDLATSAEIAGSVLRAFGIDAAETKRVVDVMAESFTSSALNLTRFQESMKFVAPIAKAANIPLEVTTAMLAKLADAGLKGSIAGTALKRLLSQLADPASDLSKTLGFTVRNAEDLDRAFQFLAEHQIDLAKATELADERSKAGLIVLRDQWDAVRDLTTAFEEAVDPAEKMANIRMDTLAGSVTILKSAWEGLVIQIEKGNNLLTKTFRFFTDVLAGALSQLKENLTAVEDLGAASALPFFQQGRENILSQVDALKELSKLENEEIDIKKETIGLIKEEINFQLKWRDEINQKLQEQWDLELELNNTKGVAAKDRLKFLKDEIADNEFQKAQINELVTLYKEWIIAVEKGAENIIKPPLPDPKEITAIIDKYDEWKFAIDSMPQSFEKQREAVSNSFFKMTTEIEDFYDKYLKTLKGDELINATEKRDSILISLEKKKNRDLLKITRDEEIEELRIQKIAGQTALQEKINADGKFTEDEKEFKDEILKLDKKFNLEKQLIYLETQKKLGAISEKEYQTQVANIKAAIEALENEIIKIEKKDKQSAISKLLGLGDEEIDAIKIALKEVLGHWTEFVDKWISELDRKIDRQDQAVLETQNQIMIEQEDREQGFSNHLTAETQKLAQLKAEREKALKERAEAAKIEGIIDTATQISSLVTASAKIFEVMSGTGPLGVPLAIGLITTMLTSFIASKALIKEKTGHLAEGDYGTVKGRRHSEDGGENFLDHIKVEDGEMWSVYNRGASSKYSKEIAGFTDSVNKGKLHAVWNDVNMGLNKEQLGILPYPFFDDSKIAKTNEKLDVLIKQNKRIPIDYGTYIEYEEDGIIKRINKNGSNRI